MTTYAEIGDIPAFLDRRPKRRPPTISSADAQSLLLDVEQPRAHRYERDDIYAAVLYLRRSGCTVFRSGRHHHVVDGRRVSDFILLAMARRVEGG